MSRVITLMGLFFAALMLSGCEPEIECSEADPCEFGSVCVEGTCEVIPCSTSAQCGMEEYCGPDRQCIGGCSEDSDCYPGDACNTEFNECEARGCRDTQRDCAFKEFCNTANGECYDAGGYYCRECQSDDDCGGNGNMCLGIGGGTYCGVTCDTDEDCPSGFGCLGVSDFNGNLISYQCLTYCGLYEDTEGFDKAAVPPLSELDLVLPECEDSERMGVQL